MDRVYTACDYLFCIAFLGVSLNFAYAVFSEVFTFYQWFIMMALANSVVALGFLLYVWKKELDLRATDTFTGTLLGAMVILVLNFVIAILYAQTLATQSLTLSVLQLNTDLIASNMIVHVCLIAPTEEICFREVLFTPLKIIFQRIFGEASSYPDGIAYGFSSAIYFAIAHQVALMFNPLLLLFPIASSVVFVYIRIKYGLYACVNAHRINNVISILM